MHSQMKPFSLNTEYKVHIKKMWEGIKTSRLVYPCKASASLANLTGMTTRIDFFLVIRTEQKQSPQPSQKKPTYDAKVTHPPPQPAPASGRSLKTIACSGLHTPSGFNTVNATEGSLSIKARKVLINNFVNVRRNFQNSLGNFCV